MFALCNARVLIDGALTEGQAVLVDGPRIAGVVAAREVPGAAARPARRARWAGSSGGGKRLRRPAASTSGARSGAARPC